MSATKNFSIVPGDTLVIVFEHETSMAGYSATFTLKSVNGTELLTGTTTGESPRLVVSGNNITLTVPHTVTAEIQEGGKYQLTTVSPAGVRFTSFQGYAQRDTFGGDSGEETDGVISRPIADFSGVGLLDSEQTWTAPQHFSEGISTNSITPDGESSSITIGQVGGSVSITGLTGSGANLSAINATNITQGSLPDARLSSNVALENIVNTFSASQVFTSPVIVRQDGGTAGTDQIEISHNGAAAFIVNKNAAAGPNAKIVFQGNNSTNTDIDVGTITANGSVNVGVNVSCEGVTASNTIESPAYFYDGNCQISSSDDLTFISNNGSVVVGNRLKMNMTTAAIGEDTPFQLVAGDGPIINTPNHEFSAGTLKMPSDPTIGLTYYVCNIRDNSYTLTITDESDNPFASVGLGNCAMCIYFGGIYGWKAFQLPAV